MPVNTTRYLITSTVSGAVSIPAEVASYLVGVTPSAGASRTLAVLRVRAGAPATTGAEDLTAAEWYDRQLRADWVPFQAGHGWAGTEKAVLIPEADATDAMATALALSWADCERIAAGVTVPGIGVTTARMAVVRYTGSKPAPLASYSPTIYAADLPAVLAVAEKPA